MYMAYSKNPNLPRARMQAVMLVRQGWSIRKVARYTGYTHPAIIKWLKKAPRDGKKVIPTLSSRPHHHPKQLPDKTVNAILDYRRRYKRCAQVLHYLLLRDGYKMSLSSVKRTLRRYNCTRYSKWKKWHKYTERPKAEKPGILVQIDTIWDGMPNNRLYAYTLIDVFSRWAYAYPINRISALRSFSFVKDAQNISPFQFLTIQSDHGGEFSKHFTKLLTHKGLTHRHSRIRTPSDNGHLERFNRTLQDECLRQISRSLKSWKKEIPEYLAWYNNKRPHMALNMKSPMDVVTSY